MSRFFTFKKKFGFSNALSIYIKFKQKKFDNIKVSNLTHAFSMRNNFYDDATFKEVILNESYDLKLPIEPQFIIDGGGNIGLTACYYATKYPKAKIITIEPEDENFSLLKLNTQNYPQIAAVKGGIWNKKTHLKITNANAGNNSFMVEETSNPNEGLLAYDINSIMFEYGFEKIDILKLDIEGSEKEVFEKNYESWLPKTKYLIVELHDRMKLGCSTSVFKTMCNYNFSFAVQGENCVFTNNDL